MGELQGYGEICGMPLPMSCLCTGLGPSCSASNGALPSLAVEVQQAAEEEGRKLVFRRSTGAQHKWGPAAGA